MHTIKPFDVEAVKNAADTGFVLTMEEHSVFGGLGSIVAGILAQYRPTKMKILAIPDEPAVAGNSAEVFYYYGITAENAVRIIREAIRKNDV